MEQETDRIATIFDELYPKVLELVSSRKYAEIRKLLMLYEPVDAAEIIEELMEDVGLETSVIVFRILPKDTAVDVFAYLQTNEQLAIISAITDKELHYIMDELDFDDMIDVLEELPANIVDKILAKTPKAERHLINTFLNYPDNSAGSLMTPEYISLRRDMTVKDALTHIKHEGMDSETVYTCYVKDVGRKLYGIISLRTIVVSDEDEIIDNLLQRDFVSVKVTDDQEYVSILFKRYGFMAMPVVDNEGRLVGIITVDDILEIIDEENTEDFQKMAGMAASTEEYLDTSVYTHVKNRFPWLLYLMISAMITGLIIKHFEDLLSSVIILTVYLPMLMGTGGNSGSQSATLIIRGMAIGEIELKDAFKVLWKELRVAFFVGFLLSLINFFKIIFLDQQSVLVALTVCISMLLIIILAKTIGGLLPMFARKINVDPAIMASPTISSLTDMVSVFSYFVLASMILGL